MKRNKCVRQEPPNLSMAGRWDLHPNHQIAPNYIFLGWYHVIQRYSMRP